MKHSESERNRAAETPGVSRGALWFGLWGGGAAWFGHLLLSYVVGEFGCVSRFKEIVWFGMTAVAWSLILISVAMLGLAALATWISSRSRRRLMQSHGAGTEAQSALSIAQTGLISNGIFCAIIVVQSVPIFFFLKDC